MCLWNYKFQSGAVNFPALFLIPSNERLPALAKNDRDYAMILVGAAVANCLEMLNLNRQMNENQVFDLSEIILDTSNEDNLSLEDLMLFLQKFSRGEYGKFYESMDIPKFMEMLELYREERFKAMNNIREEESVQFKALPVNERIVEMFPNEERGKHREALKDYLKSQQK